MRSRALSLGAILLSLLAPWTAAAQGGPQRDAMPAGPTVEERLAEIARRVQDVVSYPPIARVRRQEGEALVAFEVSPKGDPTELELRQTSGHAALDSAALRAVRDAAPLPRIYGLVVVPVSFRLRDE